MFWRPEVDYFVCIDLSYSFAACVSANLDPSRFWIPYDVTHCLGMRSSLKCRKVTYKMCVAHPRKWIRFLLASTVLADLDGQNLRFCERRWRCPMPDHPPCQIIPQPLASAPGSCEVFYDSLFSMLRLAALKLKSAGFPILFSFLENDERIPWDFHMFRDFETLKEQINQANHINHKDV